MPIRPLTQEIIDRYVSAGVWLEETYHRTVERHAQADPDKVAMTCGPKSLTYAELVSAYKNVASWLVGQGLERGDVVVLQAPNDPAIAILHLACDYAGLCLVPLTHAFRQQEVSHLLGVSAAKAVIVPPASSSHDYLEVVESVRANLPDLRLVGLLEGPGADFALDAIIAHEGPPPPEINEDPNLPTFCMITSGTTSMSRISLYSDNSLWGLLGPYHYSAGLVADDIAVGIAPANTGSTGYCFPVITPILVGASARLIEHWEPGAALALIESERATVACAIPTQIVKMLQHPDVRKHDYSTLRVFSNAGAPLAPEMAAEVEEVFGCVVQTVYGATDGGVPAMTRYDDPPEKRRSTVGRIIPETDFRLVDAERNDVAPGEPGEILWRNASKSFGYLNDEEQSEAVFTDDGYYLSGDLGAIDEDGYLRIVGRVKDMILRGGQNISPREVEEVLIAHPAIAEISIVGIPDPVYGERACACVVPAPGQAVDLETISAFLGERSLERFKFPEYVETFDDFPTNNGAKISKVELRRIVLARREPVGSDASAGS